VECHAAVGWTHAASVRPARISQRLADRLDAIADIAVHVRKGKANAQPWKAAVSDVS